MFVCIHVKEKGTSFLHQHNHKVGYNSSIRINPVSEYTFSIQVPSVQAIVFVVVLYSLYVDKRCCIEVVWWMNYGLAAIKVRLMGIHILYCFAYLVSLWNVEMIRSAGVYFFSSRVWCMFIIAWFPNVNHNREVRDNIAIPERLQGSLKNCYSRGICKFRSDWNEHPDLLYIILH